MSLTSQIRYVEALDSTATDGSGKTGLAFGDITAKYLVHGGTLTSLTTETITTLGTYQAPTSNAHIRIKELAGSDPSKGIYEVHFHNDQVVNTNKKLWLFLSASGAKFQRLEVDLLPYADLNATNAANLASAASNYSATRGLTGTAVPAAAADAAGGLPISDAGGLDLDAKIGLMDVNADGSVKSGNGTEVWSSTNPVPADAVKVEGTDATDYFATLDDAVLTAIAALNNLSQANIRTAVGLASANLDTQLDALPTNAELATALGTADDAILAAIAALNNLSAAQVNAEVVDALATDTYAEPGQGTPAATLSLAAKINYLFKSWRNKKTQTSSQWSLFADDASTVDQKASVSDDSTTATKGEIATGP